MKTIEEVIKAIKLPDEQVRTEAQRRWNSVAKPLGSLGRFEDAVVQIAALKGSELYKLNPRCLLVFCADNGVVAQGVSQCGSEVTGKVAISLAEGRSTANTMAARAACRVIPVDMGIRDFCSHSGVCNLRIRNGTGDISQEPAMTEPECRAAMMAAAELAARLAREGTELFALGEMGIGNTTTSTALVAALLGLDPETVTGRGAGLSTAGLERKKNVIRQALQRCKDIPKEPIRMMTELGGLDIAALCGAILGAAASRVPVIIDGVVTEAAALCALRLCPAIRNVVLASHISAEPLGRPLLKELGLHAVLDAGLHLGEGSGALMMLPLLDMAHSVYTSGQSFEKLGIEAYKPLI